MWYLSQTNESMQLATIGLVHTYTVMNSGNVDFMQSCGRREFMMRTLMMAAIAGGTILATGVAATGKAEARQSTKSFTCDGVRSLINRRGGVVLNTKNSNVYQRLVRNYKFCPSPLYARRTTVPTKTGPCRVRYCSQTPPLGGGFQGNFN
ncbi:hypothetical protein [Ahrensia sp. R2A130]|uniref:hypothetical protein n=1 Tax=Ahrensia sp. R2A130 TaxID=744979 RepID=UPI0012E9A4AB|nr:hypothetical protein [Ahrensia sp. R2A130]